MVATAHVSAQVTDSMIAKDAADTDSVLSWGMGTQGQRFSTLTTINTKNVSKLAPANAQTDQCFTLCYSAALCASKR